MSLNIITPPKIGLALSGGGVRASVFHAGLLKYLAERELLEHVTFISTVSGASLLLGLIYQISDNKFPTSEIYVKNTVPELKRILTETNLQKALIIGLLNPCNWNLLMNRGNIVAKKLKTLWGITNNLQEISGYPRWVINGTTRETGKCWRFSKERMGDYLTGYAINPNIPVAEAIAASAAYPPAIDHYRLNTSLYKWYKYKSSGNFSKNNSQPDQLVTQSSKYYHITDGGVYDNLGAEAVFDLWGVNLRREINYLVISDAGSNIDIKEVGQFFLSKLKRNFEIVMSQVGGLRLRSIFRFLDTNKNAGVIVKMGKTSSQLIREARKLGNTENIPIETEKFLIEAEVKLVATYDTNLKIMSKTDYDLIFNHGYETAKIQMSLYPHAAL